MKKVVLMLTLFLAFSTLSQAQEISSNAIGIRAGDNDGSASIELSYQKSIADNNRAEFDLGYRDNKSFSIWKLSGIYQWVWNIDGNFNWYAGVGAGLGNFSTKVDNTDDGIFVNLNGDIGIEYNFDIPLLLSLDFRPEFGLINDYGNNDLDLDIAIGLRYQF